MATPIIAEATGERRVPYRPVLPAGVLAALQNADDHQHADGDEDNHGADLDQREPVFRLAEPFHRNVVQQEHQAEEQRAPDPAGVSGNQ